MADPMEMSLDDIIKKNRSTRGRRGGRGRGAGGNAAGRGGNSRSPFKNQGGGFRRGGARPQARNGGAVASTAPVPTTGHIVINNLHFQVSDADLTELFGEFSSFKKSSVHFDAAGKSRGSADVIFSRYQDAVRAMQKYNGVPLDGRAMRIMIASTGLAQALSPQRQQRGGRGGQRSGPGGRGGAGGRGRGAGGRGRGGRGGTSGRTMTKEQLDAEIDAYHTKSESQE